MFSSLQVLYVYEIQLENCVRRKGLGKFMMQVLEIMAFKADMRKIMVTIFKHNPGAQKVNLRQSYIQPNLLASLSLKR